jgi:hypothetical protein
MPESLVPDARSKIAPEPEMSKSRCRVVARYNHVEFGIEELFSLADERISASPQPRFG